MYTTGPGGKSRHPSPFDAEEQWLYYKLPPDGRAPQPISKPSHPQIEKPILATCIYKLVLLGHYQDLVTIGEFWDEDGPIN